jgi:hypothetical protein
MPGDPSPDTNYPHSPLNLEIIAMLEASDDPVAQAYAEAYRAGCFVVEMSLLDSGLEFTGVGELAVLGQVDQASDTITDVPELSVQDCMDLGVIPGQGATHEDRIRDGLHKVLLARSAQLN